MFIFPYVLYKFITRKVFKFVILIIGIAVFSVSGIFEHLIHGLGDSPGGSSRLDLAQRRMKRTQQQIVFSPYQTGGLSHHDRSADLQKLAALRHSGARPQLEPDAKSERALVERFVVPALLTASLARGRA